MSDEQASQQERHFETLSREIAVAAREHGDRPDENVLLADAMRRARAVNMPDARIAAARQLGRGDADGPTWQQTTLEGYGPNGVAVYMELLTDDEHRTARDIEGVFEQHGGNLGNDGCVAWQFDRRGVLEVAASSVDDADDFMLEVIEAGGDELQPPVGNDDTFRVVTDPDALPEVAAALDAADYSVVSASIDYQANQEVPLDSGTARKFMGFFERLKERPEVVGAYANWTFA
jgi:YebC/PmpR family DNA-binding regulatory protein